MDNQILNALKNPPDYTEKFTETVQKISNDISDSIRVNLHQNKDMNYSVSQKLCLFLDENYSIANKDSTHVKYEIAFLISSKANLFTSICLQKKESQLNEKDRPYWELMSGAKIKPDIHRYIRAIGEHIIKHGYDLICGDVLQKQIDGYFTEIDGAPATIFEILFAELY